MMVLVDTPIWSLALRRRKEPLNAKEQALTAALAELIRESRAQLIGPIRQELLSGIREENQFRRLRDHLRAFNEIGLVVEDYEETARMSNQCRARGVSNSSVDMLICAVASRRRWQVFTNDQDFLRYAKVIGTGLYRLPAA